MSAIRRLAVVGVVVGALVAVASAAAQPEPVLAAPAYEVGPAAGDSYFAWS